MTLPAALYLAHLNPLTLAHAQIIRELRESGRVKVMPVVFYDGGREVNSRSFPFTLGQRREMIEAELGAGAGGVEVSGDYAFHAPFRRYLPPLISARSWALKKKILRGVGKDYYAYTGDRAEWLALKAYGLRPRIGARKEIAATSAREQMYRAAKGLRVWTGRALVPGRGRARWPSASGATVERFAGAPRLDGARARHEVPARGVLRLIYAAPKRARVIVWMDGRMVPDAEARVPVTTHAIHYGTSAFEGVRAYPAGGNLLVFRLADHLARLRRSARAYGLECPHRRRAAGRGGARGVPRQRACAATRTPGRSALQASTA